MTGTGGSAPATARPRLDGKVAIVTGGAGGIGRGIVEVFVAEGARVLFVDVDSGAGAKLADHLGDSARFVAQDLREPDAGRTIVAAAVEAFGTLNVLVNVAQASQQAPLIEHTEEMFELAFASGFRATVALMQASYPHLRASGGSVINFASGAGIDGGLGQASYAAAKEAIRGISRVAANEWAADRIRVNLISPIALTPGVQRWAGDDPAGYRAMLNRIPMRRLGDPVTDIAPVAVFLASDDSSYMTGQTLMVDGGVVKLR